MKSLLALPWLYELAHSARRGTRYGRHRAEHDLTVAPGERGLDIGCGTGVMRESLPPSISPVRSVGWDRSSIDLAAARRHDGNRGQFQGRELTPATVADFGHFDQILVTVITCVSGGILPALGVIAEYLARTKRIAREQPLCVMTTRPIRRWRHP